MESKIDIGVIVPVYNVEEYLTDCLESLWQQGNVRLEVIVIDDGSTDNSGDIAKNMQSSIRSFSITELRMVGWGMQEITE